MLLNDFVVEGCIMWSGERGFATREMVEGLVLCSLFGRRFCGRGRLRGRLPNIGKGTFVFNPFGIGVFEEKMCLLFDKEGHFCLFQC